MGAEPRTHSHPMFTELDKYCFEILVLSRPMGISKIEAQLRHGTWPRPHVPGSSTSAAIMDNRIAVASQSAELKYMLEGDSLGKNLDRAASKPLVADNTYPILRDRYVPIATTVTTRQTVTKSKTCLLVEGKDAPHSSYYPAFVHCGVG